MIGQLLRRHRWPSPAAETASPRLATALDALVRRTVERYGTLYDVFDPEWRSPCEAGPPDARGRVPWRPMRRTPPGDAEDFAGLERALETRVHPDFKALFGRYWSGHLEADAAEGPLSLLLLWNEDDRDRLVANLIGHALQRRRLRAPLTLFFACTEAESDLVLALENASGEVVIERPGERSLRPVAPSLGELLARIAPADPERHPERHPEREGGDAARPT